MHSTLAVSRIEQKYGVKCAAEIMEVVSFPFHNSAYFVVKLFFVSLRPRVATSYSPSIAPDKKRLATSTQYTVDVSEIQLLFQQQYGKYHRLQKDFVHYGSFSQWVSEATTI